ncbi:V-type sodium ATPase subunit D [bioreactor metagenome]|uniref:V-type sodium ATPase subunit D n=1 Tax=bioreactor metagenome TaxID=1076179 RepID=A0A645C971_9ZZZZ
MELRIKVEAALIKLNESFTVAAAATSDKIIEESLIYPKLTASLEVSSENIMSVIVPTFKTEINSGNDSSDIFSYGFAFTSGELDSALEYLQRILPDMITLAEKEKAAQLLSAEIERTRRRVNALEYIMIPNLELNIHSITMKLDENERGNLTRLMKVKDMMIKAQIESKQKE